MADDFNMDHEPEVADGDAPKGLAGIIPERTSDFEEIEIPELQLPKGGGALRGIDEKFAVNSANGTASLTLQLPLTPNRNGFTPRIDLSYSSGAGNGPFGLGWALGLSTIQRKTDRRLPRYLDAPDEDAFLITGAEDLVPTLQETAPGTWAPRDRTVGAYRVRQFRPRTEAAYQRIELISHAVHGSYWKVTDRANTVTFYGRSAAARVADPGDPTRVFRWLPDLSYDNKGNWIRYEYKAEDQANMPAAEAHRRAGLAPFANTYLKRVRYGNRTAWYPDPALPFDPPQPDDATHLFELVLDYGEHAPDRPTPGEVQPWTYRADAFSSYRSGFEIRTARLCQRLLMFHHFPQEDLGGDALVRSMDFTYQPVELTAAGQSVATHLSEVEQAGYVRRADGSYSRKALPPLSLRYQPGRWSRDVRDAAAEDLVDAPAGLAPPWRMVDLFGEGIAGVLTEAGNAWIYKHNRGPRADTGTPAFERGRMVAPRPNLSGLNDGTISLEDLEGNGEKQIVVTGPQLGGYFPIDGDTELWGHFRAFRSQTNLDLRDPSVKRIDLTGEGRAGIMVAEDEAFVWYASDGKNGFAAAERAWRTLDEERGPAVVFSEAVQTVFLADMTGDGLTDIARIRNGQIVYWPNLGYGRFGAKVAMSDAPVFDHPDRFDPSRLRLADITGTGPSDLIYLGDRPRAWINQAGNGWSAAQDLAGLPPMTRHDNVQVADILGQGTPCLIWSSTQPGAARAPLRYVDLMSGRKPHLLIGYSNNMGKETTLSYRSSTHDYLRDKRAGTPWVTRLPFPVQVVSDSVVEERVTGTRLSAHYTYHHGYWDAEEKEFRGFGRVDRRDTEDYEDWVLAADGSTLDLSRALFQAPMLTRTWYHNGAWDRQQRILTRYADEYWPRAYDRAFPLSPLGMTEPALPDGRIAAAPGIADPLAIARLSPEERREALRACKGIVLRQEVFALDAPGIGATETEMQRQMVPYTVDTHSCHIQLVQPRGPNGHAVFAIAEDEALQISYERDPTDPRIEHALNLEIDDLGNVLEKANVLYGRDPARAALATARLSDPATDFSDFADQPRLAAEFADALSRAEAAQERTRVLITRTGYTNDIDTDATWRARAPSEVETFEITGAFAAGDLFTLSELRGILSDPASVEIAYESDPSGGIERRRIEHQRTYYYDEGAAAALPLHQIASHGLPQRGQVCAFTPGLLSALYGGRIADPGTELPRGGYLPEDGAWWLPTGTVRYRDPADTLATLQSRFFKPRAHRDAFGSETRVRYHKSYFLMLEETADAVGNTTRIERFDFRLLSPVLLRDANDTLTAIVSDELALVKAQAFLGKDLDGDGVAELELADTLLGQDADSSAEAAAVAALLATEDATVIEAQARALLGQATMRYAYDLHAWRTRGTPAVAMMIGRERHHSVDPASPLHLSYDYTDGSGAVAMTKIQAEPGIAQQVTIAADGSASIAQVDTGSARRWTGTGRKVLNNKAKPVRSYEPYFSVTPAFESLPELVASGVSSELTYDAAGRLIRTDLPDGSFARTEFSPWQVRVFDTGDTVLQSRWHAERVGHLIDAELIAQGRDPAREAEAAQRAEIYADTPNTVCLDALGRPVLSLDHAGRDSAGDAVLFATSVLLDVEGNVREVIDARGNRPMRFGHDMLGRRLTQHSMDAGARWSLPTVSGKPLIKWDARGHVLRFAYDALQRELTQHVTGGDGPAPLDNTVMRALYGEGQPDDRRRGLRGRLFRRWDTGGLKEWTAFDGKHNLIETARRFAVNYRDLVDWSGDLEAPLEAETHVTRFAHDAVNRTVSTTAPDGSVTEHRYNEANLLEQVDVTLPGAATETLVTGIDYDAKGQRRAIRYGNGTETTYRHDPMTFRLTGLTTVKGNGDTAQDLSYTHDCGGNLTHQQDRAIPVVFFDNQKIAAVASYAYDPLYRLVSATGREHAGQQASGNFGPLDNWDDAAAKAQHQPGDAMAWRTWSQRYDYDAVGNVLRLAHAATGGSYTRVYAYEAATNRLLQTTVGSQTYAYDHHPLHGFLRQMPHLPVMRHDFRDELAAVSRQALGAGTPETTYYVYDHDGARIRKVTDLAAGPGAVPRPKDERLYLGSLEYYRVHNGGPAGLERRSLSVSDDTGRVAVIDSRNGIDDGTPLRITRYQLSNHIGSAVMELDATGRTLTYAEFHPYGTLAYQATDSTLQVAPQTYRYSGMERDEESGLSHHGARYYAPFLARWCKPDPAGIGDGINDYQYVAANPLRLSDPTGEGGWDRFLGGVKMVGGALETVAGGAMIVGGAATGWTGAGIAVAGGGVVVGAHGIDVMVSGARTMWHGEAVDTGTSALLQSAGMSREAANLTDAGISIAGSLGSSAVLRAPAAAGAVDDVLGASDDVARVALGSADEAVTGGQSSVSVAFSPGVPTGHNMVGVTTGGTTTWSHLVVRELDDVSGGLAHVVRPGTGAVIQSTRGPAAAGGSYLTATVPVTQAEAQAARALMSSSAGSAGTYSYLGNNCTTYATSVLREAGVFAPAAATPGTTFATVALQSPTVIRTAAAGGGAAGVITAASAGEELFSDMSVETNVTLAPEPAAQPMTMMPVAAPAAPDPAPQQSVMPDPEPQTCSEDFYVPEQSSSGYYDHVEGVCYAY
ncbi:SpvB/TcaC N-terminal domain-containing protein [Maliponia aquimaris]|uniref:Mono(ADP-ribosyl)transferase SpvB n=1 Tax=Maliponia aquimaris TaxID=1673631 RepID=A0A238K1R0_9RHOB|nr:SpvB/TcaC N-terminal domain-containing protein [Maliponia aquimaris]SMX36815.1 Mono(ADP-ribosyl)transferase SpvB [Maliponia aquimaris]